MISKDKKTKNIIVNHLKALILFIAFSLPQYMLAQVFWADSVLDYSSRFSPTLSSEKEILGKPNSLPQGGDLATAWKPSLQNEGYQHIRVRFPKIVNALQIFVAESYNPGSIISIELLDDNFNTITTIQETPEVCEKPTRIYNKYFQDTIKGVRYARLLLSTESVPGYNSIDAIGLSEDKMLYLTQIEEAKGKFLEEPQNLGANINTTASDRFPVISADNNTLYFCRTGDTNNYGSYYLTDIYVSRKGANGEFMPAQNIGKPLNNGYSNFVTTAMPDGNTLILGTSYYHDSISAKGISVSRRKQGNWSSPKNIRIEGIGHTGDYNEYFMTADGMYLLLAVDRIDSYGKNDIYVASRINDTLFSKPINLGPQLNTAEHEAYPFLAPDGRSLYFCSSGYPGFGETDIYLSRRIGDGWDQWSEPLNLGPKINTNKFEGNISIPASGEYAYFVSSVYGYGQEDIFKVKLPSEFRPAPIMLVSGYVTDQETGKPVEAEIIYEDIYSGEMLGTAYSNFQTGEYSISLPAGKRYSFSARSEKYYGIQENIDLTTIASFDSVIRNLSLAPIKEDYAIRLNNIFFEFGKWELLPESKTELIQLARYLKNRNIRIRIEGHTDNIGTSRNNLILSTKRAEAVYDFLVEAGIPRNSLSSKGYGESNPLRRGNSEEDNKMNRRVEFRVIKGMDNP